MIEYIIDKNTGADACVFAAGGFMMSEHNDTAKIEMDWALPLLLEMIASPLLYSGSNVQSLNPILEGTEWEGPDCDSKFELSDGALTDSGVVFSFQPYEIDCWAAGAYHFIVPYNKLVPYLTLKAKRLIGTHKSR